MRGLVIDIRGNKKVILGKYMLVVYILNLSDLCFTKFLLSKAPDLFKEINLILNPIINGVIPYFIKIGGMVIILLYWYWRSEKSNITQIKRSLLAVKVIMFFYVVINIIHLVNLIIYLGLS